MAEVPPRKRLRASRACIPCRQLKRKCDGNAPCSTCVRFHHECQYEPPRWFNTQSGNGSSGETSTADTSIKAPDRATSTFAVDNQGTDNSILDPERARYFDASSAIAFPRVLGIQFGAKKAPRMHSFAWHLGIRTEPKPKYLDVTSLLSLEDILTYSNDYFVVVSPAFDFLDQQEFTRRVSARWKGSPSEDMLNFDAVICGVVALGCFVSRKLDDGLELALTNFTRDRLDGVGFERTPTVDIIAAWILRAIYLRATSRPQGSWMASNMAMHLVEASGIQRDTSSIALIYPSQNQTNDLEKSLSRRTFWVGKAINAIFSYEYSRPRVIVSKISCAKVDAIVNDSTRDLLQMAELIPENTQACDGAADIAQTMSMLESLGTFAKSEPPVSFLCAELAFSAYRHIRLLRNFSTSTAIDPVILRLLTIGSTALKAINDHITNPSPVTSVSGDGSLVIPWWSLISLPFHFVLILLSLDTSESLSKVSYALQTLKSVAAVFDTHLTREAVQNATLLIRLSQTRKERDAEALSKAFSDAPESHEARGSRSGPFVEDVDLGFPKAEQENGDNAMNDQHLQKQVEQHVGKENAKNIDSEVDMSTFDTTILDGLQMPEDLDVDWDALFDNLDWM